VLLVGLLMLLALAVSLTPIRNYDFWWHLTSGGLILSQHAVPRTDPFSFTAVNAPWVDHEWLSQVLMYCGYRAVGAAGLVVLKAILVCGLALLMLSHVEREGHGPAGVSLLLATTLVGASFRLDVRPELATLLVLPLAFDLVLRARATGDRRPLALVPLLVALGSNLHPGIILVPVLLAAGAVVGLATERFAPVNGEADAPAGSRPGFAKRLLLVAAASAIAAGANPYGWKIYAVPFEIRRLLATLPSPNLEWTRPGIADFPLFWLAAAAVPVVMLAGLRRLDPIATPALLAAGLLAAAHLRNIGLFFVLLPFGLARPARAFALMVERLWRRVLPAVPGGVRPGFVISGVVLLCAVPVVSVLPPPFAWGLGPAPGNEPRAAVDFVDSQGIGEHLYNDVRFGGYLVWRRFPAHHVFIDGRNEVYASLLREVFLSLGDSRTWEAFLDRHGIDAAFLRYSPTLERVVRAGPDGRPAGVVERAYSVDHFPPERWALVYWDDDAMIVVRRSPGNAEVIAGHEYRAVQPEDWRYLYAGVLTGHVRVEPILAELERKTREDPGCLLARSLLATFSRLPRGPHAPPETGPTSR
jgi:hypothetical protein